MKIVFLLVALPLAAALSGVHAPRALAQGHAGHGGGAPAPPSPPVAAASPNEEPPTIEIPPERQQMIGVKTAPVARRPMERTIRTVGRVEVDEQRQVAVTTKYEGWVETLQADATGKFVRKGEPLAEIYSPEIFATQQEFLNLLRWKKDPGGGAASSWETMLGRDRDAILEAARERLRLWDITDGQIRAIEASGKPIRTLTLFSPITGFITQKMVVRGMRIMPGEKLFDIADLSTVWVIADVYEYELPLIRPGLAASVRLSYFPGKELTSKIDYVYPTLSGESRTARVRLVLPNPGGTLKPQMFTSIELTVKLGDRLTVPSEAVIDTGTRKIAYVDRGEGLFEPREVVTGLATEWYVEILRGVKEGERVASSANFLIDSEAQLRGVVPLQRK